VSPNIYIQPVDMLWIEPLKSTIIIAEASNWVFGCILPIKQGIGSKIYYILTSILNI